MREIFLIMVRLNITSFSRKEHPGWVQGRTVYTGRRISVRFGYISIFTNLIRTDNETKSMKTVYN